ncbi:MAG: hypothetical protein LR011_03735 [Verrucomicrobia bacterium]|nr:hypothetical protein [Verrucomicrobiota bacterium]
MALHSGSRQFGNAVDFDGGAGGSYARVADFEKSPKAVTVSAWVRARTIVANASILRNDGDHSALGQFSIGVHGASPRIANTVTINGFEQQLVSDTDLDPETWTHVAVVIAENRHYLFQDGKLVASGQGGSLPNNPLAALGIGARMGDDGQISVSTPQLWDGQIDDVAIWSRALNSLEILSISVKGQDGMSLGDLLGVLPVHITRQPEDKVLPSGMPIELTIELEGQATFFQWYKNGQPIPGQVNANLLIGDSTAGNSGLYSVVVGNALGAVTSGYAQVDVVDISQVTTDLIGYWPFNESSGMKLHDYSGFNSDGDLIGYSAQSTSWVTGKVGNALHFGGIIDQQYVLVPAYPKADRALTLSAWVKAESLDYDATIVKNWGDGTTLSGADVLGQFQLGLASTTGQVSGRMPLSDAGIATAGVQNSAAALVPGEWTHIAMVYTSPDNQNSVTNGQFDSSLSSWKIEGSVGHDGSFARFGLLDASGNNSISQTIPTVSGETYAVRFDYRDDSIFSNQSMIVSVDGLKNLLTSDPIVTSLNGVDWVTYTLEFKADSSSAIIKFTDTSDTSGLTNLGSKGVDGFLDNVGVTLKANGSLRLYQNGQLVSSTPLSHLKDNPLINSLGIGVRLNDMGNGPSWDMSYWHGEIDELTLWNRSITFNEVSALYYMGNNSTGLSDLVPALAPQSLEWVAPVVDSKAHRTPQPMANDGIYSLPEIRVEESNGIVTLSWPSGFQLLSSESPVSQDWQPVDGADSDAGVYRFDTAKSDTIHQFFKLSLPPNR